ncbi:MAG: 6,7-dimethyl-8-ribityllumazine synthase [Candidatus Liptonbacteria bacterium]|nr:6,7-dimethyl-8-ribityllumazine synthase [Candidatus Liptonbacteria bacterium]
MQNAKKIKKTKINGAKFSIGIVVADFNRDITSALLKGALSELKKNSVPEKNIQVVHVPGSFEIPFVCERLASSQKYHALIALGCIIKGETNHNVYLSNAVSFGLMHIIIQEKIPIGFGILTPNNLRQAKTRATGQNNKGQEAAEAALYMANLNLR